MKGGGWEGRKGRRGGRWLMDGWIDEWVGRLGTGIEMRWIWDLDEDLMDEGRMMVIHRQCTDSAMLFTLILFSGLMLLRV